MEYEDTGVRGVLELKEKTMVFWVGVILFCLAFIALFEMLWMIAVVMYPTNRLEFTKGLVPLIVGSIIFMFVGVAMIRSERRKPRKPSEGEGERPVKPTSPP